MQSPSATLLVRQLIAIPGVRLEDERRAMREKKKLDEYPRI